MEKSLLEIMLTEKKGKETTALIACNEVSEKYGLALNEQQAVELLRSRDESLRQYGRVELGGGVLPQLVFQFCDSPYLNQQNYADMLAELQDIFYLFKEESMDLLSDDELLIFMKEQFEGVCFGDTDYLASTCLERFVRAVRAGYQGFRQSGGSGEYENLSEEQHWDRELYMEVLRDLCWR